MVGPTLRQRGKGVCSVVVPGRRSNSLLLAGACGTLGRGKALRQRCAASPDALCGPTISPETKANRVRQSAMHHNVNILAKKEQNTVGITLEKRPYFVDRCQGLWMRRTAEAREFLLPLH